MGEVEGRPRHVDESARRHLIAIYLDDLVGGDLEMVRQYVAAVVLEGVEVPGVRGQTRTDAYLPDLPVHVLRSHDGRLLCRIRPQLGLQNAALVDSMCSLSDIVSSSSMYLEC